MGINGCIAVVTGGSHGLGFETARRLAQEGARVIITATDGLIGKAAADKLELEGLNVTFHPMDPHRPQTVLRLRQWLTVNTGRLDILVNCPEHVRGSPPDGIRDVELEALHEELDARAFSVLGVTQGLMPLMEAGGWGRIVNVGAGAGRLGLMGGDHAAYRLAIAGLHAITAMLGAETSTGRIRVNAVDPEIPEALEASQGEPELVAGGGEGVMAAVRLADDGPHGRLLRHGETVDW